MTNEISEVAVGAFPLLSSLVVILLSHVIVVLVLLLVQRVVLLRRLNPILGVVRVVLNRFGFLVGLATTRQQFESFVLYLRNLRLHLVNALLLRQVVSPDLLVPFNFFREKQILLHQTFRKICVLRIDSAQIYS